MGLKCSTLDVRGDQQQLKTEATLPHAGLQRQSSLSNGMSHVNTTRCDDVHNPLSLQSARRASADNVRGGGGGGGAASGSRGTRGGVSSLHVRPVLVNNNNNNVLRDQQKRQQDGSSPRNPSTITVAGGADVVSTPLTAQRFTSSIVVRHWDEPKTGALGGTTLGASTNLQGRSSSATPITTAPHHKSPNAIGWVYHHECSLCSTDALGPCTEVLESPSSATAFCPAHVMGEVFQFSLIPFCER